LRRAGKVPPEVFTTATAIRSTARKKRYGPICAATRLLREAGLRDPQQKLTNVKTGESHDVEVLIEHAQLGADRLPYKPALDGSGISTDAPPVDDAQYETAAELGLDMIVMNWGRALSPATSSVAIGRTQSADAQGSRNYVASRTRPSTLWWIASFRQKAAPAPKPPPRRSTACCCEITNVVPQWTTVAPSVAGIASAGPRHCRNNATALPDIWW